MEGMVKKLKNNIVFDYIQRCEVDVCSVPLFGLLVALFFIFYRSAYNEKGSILGLNYNYVTYFTVLIVSFLVFLVLEKLFNAKTIKGPVAFGILVIIFFYIFEMYRDEDAIFAGGNDHLLRGSVDHKIYAGVLICASLMIMNLMRKYKGETIQNISVFRKVYSLMISFLLGMMSYSFNIYKDAGIGGLWHIHAYLNSIINVYNGVPYSDEAQSIYGHYGIIYYPFVKLFGGNLEAVMVSVSMFVFLTGLIAMYVINKVVENDLLFLVSGIALFAMEVVYRTNGQYFQVFPHRVLFPVVILAWIITKDNIEKKNVRLLIEIILGSLALLWNIESGLFCMVSIIAVNIIDEFQFNISVLLKKILWAISEVCICFILSYCFTNMYSLAVGGRWIGVSTYIFPLATTSYTDGFLRTPFQAPIFWYVLYVFIFTCTLYPVCCRRFLRLQEGRLSIEDRIIIANNISGLLLLLYFINRQAFNNVTISYFQLVIALSIMANKYLKKEYQHNSTNIVAVVLLSVMSLDCIISVGRSIDNRVESVWEIDSLKRDVEKFESWRNTDVIAMGVGVPELYFYLGEDSNSAMTDWADMWDYGRFEKILLESNTIYIASEPKEEVADILEKYHYNLTRQFEGEIIRISEYSK